MPEKLWLKIGVATMWVAEHAPRAQRGPHRERIIQPRGMTRGPIRFTGGPITITSMAGPHA